LQAIFYAFAGLFMKISDDAHDKKNNILLGIAAAILCGASIGYLAVYSADAACIFLAILIGTTVAWKVDCLNHLISFIVFLGIILIFNFPIIGIITLAVCSIAAFADEIGNDGKWAAEGKPLYTFFKYRFALKIVIFIFAVLGLFKIFIFPIQIPGIQIFSFQTFIYFMLFEISYEVVGLKFDAIYNGFYSFLRIFRSIDGSADN
jgi:hypothetical protein